MRSPLDAVAESLHAHGHTVKRGDGAEVLVALFPPVILSVPRGAGRRLRTPYEPFLFRISLSSLCFFFRRGRRYGRVGGVEAKGLSLLPKGSRELVPRQ